MEISFYKQWIAKGQPYAEGVEFYALHCQNNTLKRLFATGASKYNKQKLSEEIQKVQYIAQIPSTGNRPKPKIDRNKLPSNLQTEYDKLSDLIKLMSYKHAQLEVVKTDIERHSLAKEILSAADERRIIFNRIDHYLATGKDLVQALAIKPQPEQKQLRELQLRSELNKLRVQRSKLKANNKRIADYNTVIARITEIETELNATI